MSGFYSTRPLGREHRRELRNKELMEKERLARRREKYERNSNYLNPLENIEVSCNYSSEADRFGEVTFDRLRQKENKSTRKQHDRKIRNLYDSRRSRDELRHTRMENEKKMKKRRMTKTVEGKNLNNSSVNYNLLNLKPEKCAESEMQYQHDMSKYKASLRAKNLYFQQHREMINPITGGQLNIPINVPNRPIRETKRY